MANQVQVSLILIASTNVLPSEPKNVKVSLQHLGWLQAMHDELDALHHNKTRDLIPRSSNANVVRC